MYIGSEEQLKVYSYDGGIKIPFHIKHALSEYFCMVPAIADIPGAEGIAQKFYHLDKCIFVPRSTAESYHCEGLQLFKNISGTTTTHNFCKKLFGMLLTYVAS